MAIEKPRPERGLIVGHPFRELEEIGRRFEDFFGRPFLPASWRPFPSEEKGWSPAIDVLEKADSFVLKVELPGVKEEDVDISVSGNVLTVSGEKKAESEVQKKGYYYSESSYGSFSRSITVPSTVDASKIKASYAKGILEITLPKAAGVQPKKIEIAGEKKEAPRAKK